MEIQLVREHTFGNTDQKLIGKLSVIAVDTAGYVYIGDPDLQTIHIFDSNGRYLDRLGSEGRGPGEFISGPWPFIVSDQLLVFDPMQSRVTMFSLDSLKLIRDITLNFAHPEEPDKLAGLSLRELKIIDDQTFLASFEPLIVTRPKFPGQKIELRRHYYLLNGKGRITANKLLEQRGSIWQTARIEGRVQQATNFPFLGKPLVAVSPSGHLFAAWSEDFLIKVYDTQGKYKYAFYFPYQNVRLTWESINKHLNNLRPSVADFRRRIIRQNNLPKLWPALNEILIDDENRLWISTIVDDFEVYQWWVLKDSGELLARFTWPRSKQIKVVKNGSMYARETEEETGLEEIVRYRIVMD